MNYRHIYHAGNFADIFKHIILTLCLEKLHEKPAPFFVLDTHAGIGKYDLSDERVAKTGEAFDGIKKLLAQKNFTALLPSRFLNILAKINCCQISDLPHKLKIYAGSPVLIKDYLRRDDRAIFAELNQQDFLQLKKSFAGNKKFSLLNCDGFQLVKSKLPPLEKRGLILIDPAFEKDQKKISDDYERIIVSLDEGYRRFAHGIYLIWYPIIESDQKTLEKFYAKIMQLKFQKIMRVIFSIGKVAGEEKMTSCGMLIINAPWQLDEKLKKILPPIIDVLKRGEGEGSLIEVLHS